MPRSKKVFVTSEFRQMMFEFTVSYLLEQPKDPIAFAADYFERLRKGAKEITRSEADELSTEYSFEDESSHASSARVKKRRKSIAAEPYNPEEDDDTPLEFYTKPEKEKQILKTACQNIFIFRSLDEDQMDEILNAAFPKHVKKNEEIITQGDDGDNFYVIKSGVYNVYKNVHGHEKKIYTYYHSGSFGELALLYNEPRAATVRAVTDGELWALSRQTFKRIVMQRAFKKRKVYDSLIASVPMLESLKLYERMNLADALSTRQYNSGERIIKQGDVADGMYFIESGEADVTITGEDGEEIQIKRLHNGDYFGELALLTQKPRAASVYAVGPVKTAFLDVDAFERLLGPCKDIMQRNILTYEKQLMSIFGSKSQMTDMR